MTDSPLPIITLTTDFGTSDHYVACVKAAILSVTTRVALVDIAHDVPAHDVLAAGWILRNAVSAFPRRTVHLAVADPGVGTARRPIAVATENHLFVAPDNGLLSPVLEIEPPARVVKITATHYMRSPVSSTFHARDIFGPAAAHLALGVELSHLGEPVEDIVRLELPRPKVTPEGSVRATVIQVDRFGNVVLNLTRSAVEAVMRKLEATRITARVGDTTITRTHDTYGEAEGDALFLLFNSSGLLEISVNRGRAADRLDLRPGDAADIGLTR